jgi:hypothetical protein
MPKNGALGIQQLTNFDLYIFLPVYALFITNFQFIFKPEKASLAKLSRVFHISKNDKETLFFGIAPAKAPQLSRMSAEINSDHYGFRFCAHLQLKRYLASSWHPSCYLAAVG